MLALGLAAGPATALVLPSPSGQRAQDVALLQEVGARADRVLLSVVPGPVVNDEQVLVSVSGTGAPASVVVEQRLQLSGAGDYQVRERGPARASEPLGDEPPPVTKFGAVVWQGFSPGVRELAARLTLDPVLEAARLPLLVELAGAPVGAGGAVAGPGTVVVRLTNRTVQPATLPTAGDAEITSVAAALDIAAASTTAAPGSRLPAAGDGLPAEVASTGDAVVEATSGVPLRVSGSVLVTGAPATVTGPATTAVPGGAELAGTLPPGATAELVVELDAAGELVLDLVATPAFDPRTLVPPDGAASWAAWAMTDPDADARQAALDLLVQTAATGARATSYSPYLGADLPGTGSTVFRYALAPVAVEPVTQAALVPQAAPIALAGAAVLLLAGNAVLLWRRS